jgi:hypothetical protein
MVTHFIQPKCRKSDHSEAVSEKMSHARALI